MRSKQQRIARRFDLLIARGQSVDDALRDIEIQFQIGHTQLKRQLVDKLNVEAPLQPVAADVEPKPASRESLLSKLEKRICGAGFDQMVYGGGWTQPINPTLPKIVDQHLAGLVWLNNRGFLSEFSRTENPHSIVNMAYAGIFSPRLQDVIFIREHWFNQERPFEKEWINRRNLDMNVLGDIREMPNSARTLCKEFSLGYVSAFELIFAGMIYERTNGYRDLTGMIAPAHDRVISTEISDTAESLVKRIAKQRLYESFDEISMQKGARRLVEAVKSSVRVKQNIRKLWGPR